MLSSESADRRPLPAQTSKTQVPPLRFASVGMTRLESRPNTTARPESHSRIGPAPHLQACFAFLISAVSAGTIVKQVAHHTHICDLEDRGFSVLVDGDDGARALHADDVLDGPADAERHVELGRNRLAGAANLALQRQPSVIADGPRCRKLAAQRLQPVLQQARRSSAP